MTSDLSEPSTGGFLGLLRSLAGVAALIGAVGSVELMLRAGRATPPFLLVIFVFWVLSPFALFALGFMMSKRWSIPARAALYVGILLVAPASLAMYAHPDFRPAGTKNASVAPISWIVMTVPVGIAMLASRRRAERHQL
jgi:hypothetical protein